MIKQAGNGHEWRELTDKEVVLKNPELLEKMARQGAPTVECPPREDLPSWYKTRECTRCGLLAPDYLDAANSSCNTVIVRDIHES
jgi:hypothetical protein